MTRTILIFGLISGLIFVVEMAIVIPLCINGQMDFDNSEILGYSTMVLSFLLVFFGIRTHRENNGGTIGFWKAFRVGILITLVACAIYVVSWQILYFGFVPEFWDSYVEHSARKMAADGKPAADIAAHRQQMMDFKKYYDNPLINAGVTLMEIFPIGLIVTLISAAILRRKTVPPRAGAVATA